MGGLHLHRPTDIGEVLRLLRDGDDSRCLAGGATLVAMMNAHLVSPTALVSLAAIPELRGIAADGPAIRIGAMTRHAETAASDLLSGSAAVLRSAAGQIANPVVRNMGTIGGAIAFADPAADYPPALVAAAAEIEIRGASGTRRLPADEFFVDWYKTALAPGEMVTAVLLPRPAAGGHGRFHKLARVSGDFAIASVAIALEAANGRIAALRVAVGGCGPKPLRAPEIERRLAGAPLDRIDPRPLGEALAAQADPVDDVRASAAYRRLVIPRMIAGALADAAAALRQAA